MIAAVRTKLARLLGVHEADVEAAVRDEERARAVLSRRGFIAGVGAVLFGPELPERVRTYSFASSVIVNPWWVQVPGPLPTWAIALATQLYGPALAELKAPRPAMVGSVWTHADGGEIQVATAALFDEIAKRRAP